MLFCGIFSRAVIAYLSSVCFLHIAEQKPDPFQPSLLQLHYVLWGVKRCESEENREVREQLPISPNLLKSINEIWNAVKSTLNR